MNGVQKVINVISVAVFIFFPANSVPVMLKKANESRLL